MNRGRFSPEKKREIVLAVLCNEEEITPVVEQVTVLVWSSFRIGERGFWS